MLTLFNIVISINVFNDLIIFLYYLLLYMYINIYNLIYMIIIFIISFYFYYIYIANIGSQIYLIKKCFLKFILIHCVSISTSLFSFLFHNHYGLINDEYEEFFILSSAFLLLYSIIFYIEYYFVLKKYDSDYYEITNNVNIA